MTKGHILHRRFNRSGILTRLQTLAFCATAAIGTATVASAQEEVIRPVKLLSVPDNVVTIRREFYGHVSARKTVDMAFQVSGQVFQLPVTEGNTLKKGDMIAQLDLERFELALNQARLEREQAERLLERLEKLKGSTASQATIDDATTAAGLARLAERNAQRSLEDATLFAPFDALVAARVVEAYSTVSQGHPVVRLHDMSRLHIKVDVPEILVQNARESDVYMATANFPAYPGTFRLDLLELQTEASSVGQTYTATFAFTPPEGATIFPGSSARVMISTEGDPLGIPLPYAAVGVDPDGKMYVYRFSPTGADVGTLEKVYIDATATETGTLRVQEGLVMGDEIVAAGLARLSDGMKVSRFEGFGQ